MKDFFDCFQMIKEESISKEFFKEAILETFFNRGTKVGLVPDIADILSTRWNGFARRNRVRELKLNIVVQEINEFMRKIGIED